MDFSFRVMRMHQLRDHAEQELRSNFDRGSKNNSQTTVDFYISNYIKELVVLITKIVEKLRLKPMRLASLRGFVGQLEWLIEEANTFIQRGNFEKLVESPNLARLYKTLANAKMVKEQLDLRVRMAEWREDFKDSERVRFCVERSGKNFFSNSI
jgi:hypothetical protein